MSFEYAGLVKVINVRAIKCYNYTDDRAVAALMTAVIAGDNLPVKRICAQYA